MQLGRKLLAFQVVPATTLVIVLYSVLFTAISYGDLLPQPPTNQGGLNLTRAYADLQHIAQRPHPYNSHANDIVHQRILDRIRDATADTPDVQVVQDFVSNASWASWSSQGAGSSATYSESTNILVKIPGTDPQYASTGAVLLSAHYDSVSTAAGATDDGMGVATLIQLVEYLAKNRPKRTAIFNINNGEEDGLCGAFVFLKHPWSNYTDTFLNLEGAAAGGRPLLFRGTSTPALRSFHVPNPHGNVLSADAFSRGVIRSGTDYTVYTGVGMEGLDLAFYRGRSKYHTKFDAIPHTVGQEKALWAMLESAKVSGLSLLNDDETHGTGSLPVYFDLFGVWLVVLSLDTLLLCNIVLLVVGPVVLLLLVFADAAILHARTQLNGHVPQSDSHLARRFFKSVMEFGWVKDSWVWAKFWAALLVAVGLQALLVLSYLKFNPFIVHSRPGLVVISIFTLTYVGLVLVVAPTTNSHLPERQKNIMFLQTYIFTWIGLVLATSAASSGIGGLYFITAWNAAVLLACVVGCIENMLGAEGSYEVYRRARHVHYAPLPVHDDTVPPAEAETEDTETTPLLPSTPARASKEENGAIGWWILQLVIAVTVPVTLLGHILVLLAGAMTQTLSDGSSPLNVYAALSILVFMMVLPVVPFTFKTHSMVAHVFTAIFVLSTLFNLFTFPFSQEEPVKVSFQQTVYLGNISSPLSQVTHATTSLTGLGPYLEESILPKLPSTAGQNISCAPTSTGVQKCLWNTTLLPTPGDVSVRGAHSWLDASILRMSAHSAKIVVRGRNTRGCRLVFHDKPVKYVVKGSEGGILPQFSGDPAGVSQLWLWSREWDRRFTVDIEWEGDEALRGLVACEWAEYESASVGVPESIGKIPALEEVLTFLPRWAAATKAAAGLVEAYVDFAI
ncbi:hypothetical protein FB45DRAFT_792335 [Roridomyces roridus]|uniref:Peptide hydrolase n=1 Tax=Roridomyces roridus TaxID=1738132 RepID=A0AAD7BX77_9AGAR|nr:hypothetical protein FB45DRAFT_792335 [Roridomyces roridus]